MDISLKKFLDEKAAQYNRWSFLDTDPIQIPHRYDRPADIEIAGLFAALFAWGQRPTIINKTTELLERMAMPPHDFVMEFDPALPSPFKGFVHRTFNETDIAHLVLMLQSIYQKHASLEAAFTLGKPQSGMEAARAFFGYCKNFGLPARTLRHISNPEAGSAAKRINMYLRWMVRTDAQGVDFGIWKSISPGQLSCPLDVHSGSVARALGLLQRKQNDARAVMELDENLRKLDPTDPVKYDFALFGLGVFEKFANQNPTS